MAAKGEQRGRGAVGRGEGLTRAQRGAGCEGWRGVKGGKRKREKAWDSQLPRCVKAGGRAAGQAGGRAKADAG